MAAADAAVVDRQFLRLGDGRQVHLRRAGVAQPGQPALLLAHAAPGGSAQLLPLIGALARHALVLAPDMAGLGDSDPLPQAQPSLADHVPPLLDLLDRLGVAEVAAYGQHAGAHLVCELALARPQRVRRVALDGLALFDAPLQRELLARYAPPLAPRADGSHLLHAWQMVGGMFTHFPHYRQHEAQDGPYRLHGMPVPEPSAQHALVVELLKCLPRYHLAYAAAFGHALAECLPRLAVPALLMATEGDPLSTCLTAAARLLPAATVCHVSRDRRTDALLRFLLEISPP